MKFRFLCAVVSRPAGNGSAVAWWGLRLLLVAGIGLSGLLVNHNLAWWPTSRQTFLPRLDRAIRFGTDWMVTRQERSNSILLYMIADMADLSEDQRLRLIVADFLADPRFHPNYIWRRMLDPTTQVKPPTREQLDLYQDYNRWILYAIAPQEVKLTFEEQADMFAPDRFVWGSRTHQLFALIIYRSRVENSPVVHDLINHLSEKIALEAHWDIRVTDLYLQRLAFILAAGRPDLIKRRWVERAIASQKQDGGWVESWYGWGPRLFRFSVRQKVPISHTTVQGMWFLYMLKYRYPEWIEQHYP